MSSLLLLLFSFVVIGLMSDKLGRATYPMLGLVILVYMGYAYTHAV